MTSESNKPDLYKQAGVDVDKGDRLVEWLQGSDGSKRNTTTKFGSIVSGIGGFAALFRPNFSGLKDPLLVTSTDGVGTKVLLGIESNILTGLGLDLVAMCVNDLYTVGGRPLVFLDYYATGTLDEAQFKDVLTGIKEGCRQSQALLLGGETAEMPGLYEKRHFDLAGFVVGAVDGAAMLGAHNVQAGDVLLALPSSGFHSNGYSLIRRWTKEKQPNTELMQRLMTPTRIYHELPELVEKLGTKAIHAVANITGGGISGNVPRVMPPDTACHIDFSALPIPPWMRLFIEDHGSTVPDLEAVFNLGCGMIAAVAKDAVHEVVAACKDVNLPVCAIGEVKAAQGEAKVVFH